MQKKIWLLSCLAAVCLGVAGCGNTAPEPITPPSDYGAVQADFSVPSDPPLLKKVAMYNAGCIDPLENYTRDASKLTALSADSLRIDLSIGKVNGTAGREFMTAAPAQNGAIDLQSLQFDFSRLDSVLTQLDALAVRPYLSWSYLPLPLQADGDWTDLDTSLTNWREVWEEMLYQSTLHYKDLGLAIGYHEIYNEPDLEILKEWGVFGEDYTGFLDVEDFLAGVYPDLYEYGARGILRADPDAVVGGPAFALGEIGVESWVGFLSRVKAKELPLDFYSFHSYLDGDTWFLSAEQRAAGAKNELEKVVTALGKDKYFVKTAVHINEYSYLNSANGASDGAASSFNTAVGAVKTLDALLEVVDRTTVQWVHWAQFMESTFGDDPYGLIFHKTGTPKPAYHALCFYSDMPILRYAVQGTGTEQLSVLASADGEKIAYLIWNSGEEPQNISLTAANAPFAEGTRRVYRIDDEHTEPIANEVADVLTDGCVWYGTVPVNGVVYVTVNAGTAEDLTGGLMENDFAEMVKVQYYYEDRFRGLEGNRGDYADDQNGIIGSYAHFDRRNWQVCLGMGSATGRDGEYVGQAHASAAALCRKLPTHFTVEVLTEGAMQTVNENTALTFRVDFWNETTQCYETSVLFHNGVYNELRDPQSQDRYTRRLAEYAWGTERAADQVVRVEGTVWTIDLTAYAPDWWDPAGKALLSFDLQNTGGGTRVIFKLTK